MGEGASRPNFVYFSALWLMTFQMGKQKKRADCCVFGLPDNQYLFQGRVQAGWVGGWAGAAPLDPPPASVCQRPQSSERKTHARASESSGCTPE